MCLWVNLTQQCLFWDMYVVRWPTHVYPVTPSNGNSHAPVRTCMSQYLVLYTFTSSVPVNAFWQMSVIPCTNLWILSSSIHTNSLGSNNVWLTSLCKSPFVCPYPRWCSRPPRRCCSCGVSPLACGCSCVLVFGPLVLSWPIDHCTLWHSHRRQIWCGIDFRTLSVDGV